VELVLPAQAKNEAEAKRAEAGDEGGDEDDTAARVGRNSGSADIAAGFLANVMQNNAAPPPSARTVSMGEPQCRQFSRHLHAAT